MRHTPRVTLTLDTEEGLAAGSSTEALLGTGTAVPGGIECHFKYNGLLFNNTRVIDKIRVTNIAGLDDADVRDSREENPAYEGETPYSSLPGGRTIVFTGRVEAYTLQKLRDMQMAIRNAFIDTSEEKPLYFLTGNSSYNHYIMCKKFSKLQWDEEQTKDNFFRDFQITLRASNPRFLRTTRKYEVIPYNTPSTSLDNEGNYYSQPIVKFIDNLDNIQLYNDATDETFKFDPAVQILTGSSITVDFAKNTIIDNNGNNVFGYLDPESDWLSLAPGTNNIEILPGTCGSTDLNGSIQFIYRDSWI